MEITASLLNDLCSLIYIDEEHIEWKEVVSKKEDISISCEGDVVLFSSYDNRWYIPRNEIITLNKEGKGFINLYMDYHEKLEESTQRKLLPIRAYVVSPLTENHVVRHTLGLKN